MPDGFEIPKIPTLFSRNLEERATFLTKRLVRANDVYQRLWDQSGLDIGGFFPAPFAPPLTRRGLATEAEEADFPLLFRSRGTADKFLVSLSKEIAELRFVQTKDVSLRKASEIIDVLALSGTPLLDFTELMERLPVLDSLELTDEEQSSLEVSIAQRLLPPEEQAKPFISQGKTEPLGSIIADLLTRQGKSPELIASSVAFSKDEQALHLALQQIYAPDTVSLPVGWTEEQALAEVKDIIPNEDIPEDEEFDLEAAIASINEVMQEQVSFIQSERERTSPPAITYILQPMLKPLEMLGIYNQNVAVPLAGIAVNWIMRAIPGEADSEKRFFEHYDAARANDMNFWEASATAFEEWEFNGFVKFLAEVAFDPLSYVAIGLIPKIFGKFGHAGRAIARVDQALASSLNLVVDEVFHLVSRGLGKVGLLARFPSTIALAEAKEAQRVMMSFFRVQFGSDIRGLAGRTDEIVKALQDVLKIGGKETSPDHIRALYPYLVDASTITRSEIIQLSKRMAPVAGEQITFKRALDIGTDTLEHVQSMLDNVLYAGTKARGEGIDRLIFAMNAANSPKNVKILEEFLAKRFGRGAERFILSLRNIDPWTMTKKLREKVFREFVAIYKNANRRSLLTEASQIGGVRTERGLIGGVILSSSDKYLNWTVTKALEKYAINFAAKLNLGFSGYYFFNIFENWFRAAIGGSLPSIRSIEFMFNTYGHLKNIPFDVGGEFVEALGINALERSALATQLRQWGKLSGMQRFRQLFSKDFILGDAWIRASARHGSVLRNGYWDSRFMRHFGQALAETPTLEGISRKAIDTINSLPVNRRVKSLLKREWLRSMAAPDPAAAIKGLTTRVEESALKKSAAHNIISTDSPELVSTAFLHDLVERQLMFGDIPGSVGRALDIEKRFRLFDSEEVALNFQSVLDELGKITINSEAEYFDYMQRALVLLDSYQQFPKGLMNQAQDVAKRIPTSAGKDELWIKVLDSQGVALDTAAQAVDDMFNFMEAAGRNLFKGKKLNNQLTHIENIRRGRISYGTKQAEIRTFRSEFFVGRNKGTMGAAEWDEFYQGLNDIYQKFVPEEMLLREEEIATRIGQSTFTPKAKKDFSQQAYLSAEDLGYILGSHPNDVMNAILSTAYLQDENMFVAMIRAYSKRGRHVVGDEQIRQGYRELWKSANIKNPARMNSLTRVEMQLKKIEQELSALKRSVMLEPAKRTAVAKAMNQMSAEMTQQISAGALSRTALASKAQEAADLASRDFFRNFPKYDNDNAMNAMMRHFYPYWGYEWQRPLWVTRLFATKPIAPLTWSKYEKYTDRGYIRIPGTDIEINPTRGTIFMGGFFGLLYDFPEFESDHPAISNLMDFQQRMGFYPNIIIQGLFTGLQSSQQDQFGKLIPQPINTLLALMERVPYLGDEVTKFRLKHGGSFHTYNIANAATIITQDRNLPYTGLNIWDAVTDGTIEPFVTQPELQLALESEDEARRGDAERLLEMKGIWEEAAKLMAAWDVPMTQLGILRLYPREREAYRDDLQAVMQKISGLSEREIKQAWRQGYSLAQLMGRGYTPEEKELMENVQGYFYWSGITEPVRPYNLQRFQSGLRKLRTEHMNNRKGLAVDLTRLGNQLISEEITFETWQSETSRISKLAESSWEILRGQDEFVGLPDDILERAMLYKELGMPQHGELPSPSYIYLLLDLYFKEEPQLVKETTIDGRTFERRDWSVYFAKLDRIREVAEEWGHGDEWNSLLTSEYMAPLDVLRRDMEELYIRNYWDLSRLILENDFTPNERTQILEVDRGQTTPEPDSDLNELWNKFTRLRTNSRQRYRQLFPEADYWLRFFGIVQSAQTDAAERLWLERGYDIRKIPGFEQYIREYPTFVAEDSEKGWEWDL